MCVYRDMFSALHTPYSDTHLTSHGQYNISHELARLTHSTLTHTHTATGLQKNNTYTWTTTISSRSSLFFYSFTPHCCYYEMVFILFMLFWQYVLCLSVVLDNLDWCIWHFEVQLSIGCRICCLSLSFSFTK